MKALHRWVSWQRTSYTEGRLLPYRREKLEKIGFVWRLSMGECPGKWMKKYEELKTFQGKFYFQ
jgi:hypothetical protein